MKMIKAIIRPEKLYEVMDALDKEGFKGITIIDVTGRGKEGGIEIRDKAYDELCKTLLMIAVEENNVEKVVKTIMDKASIGFFGDGKIFVSNIEEVWTIRTKKKEEEI